MGRLLLPSEKGSTLSEFEGEALFALYRAAVSKTLSSDTLSVEGTGRYTVSAQSGVTDQITAITVTQEQVAGCFIVLHAASGHTITLVHNSTIRLDQGINRAIVGPRSSIALRHETGNVWHQAWPLLDVP